MPEKTTKYFENIINLIENNVKLLEIELKEGGFFAKFIIRRNLKRRKIQLKYYRALLNEYKKRKLAK
jgi:hypothetical protein